MKTILMLFVLQIFPVPIRLTAQEAYPVLASIALDTLGKEERSPLVYEYRLIAYAYELSQMTPSETQNGIFGESIDRKLALTEKLYVTKKEIVPGNPRTRDIIRKPVIYLAVRKTERFLIRQVKQHEMQKVEAEKLMNQVLNVALSLFPAESDRVEQALASIRDDQTRLNFFRYQIKLI